MSIEIIEPTRFDEKHNMVLHAIGRCECGEELVLTWFRNTCECGRDYSWSGQELNPLDRSSEDDNY